MTENVHGLVAAYAVDAVDAQERADFEAHLPGCEDCALELAELREVTAQIAAAEAGPVPSGLRARVLDEVSRTAQLPPHPDSPENEAPASENPAPASSPWRRWRVTGLVAASAILIAGGVAVGGVLAERNAHLDMEQDVMMVASAPDAHAMDLGLGQAHLVMSEKLESVAAMGEDCPQPKDGMEYQLWLVMEDGSKMAGPTFMPDKDGSFMTVMDTPMDGLTGIVVTEEPRGGSEQPTSGMVAAVEL